MRRPISQGAGTCVAARHNCMLVYSRADSGVELHMVGGRSTEWPAVIKTLKHPTDCYTVVVLEGCILSDYLGAELTAFKNMLILRLCTLIAKTANCDLNGFSMASAKL